MKAIQALQQCVAAQPAQSPLGLLMWRQPFLLRLIIVGLAFATVACGAPEAKPARNFVVHGWWVIDVVNPDGSPARHAEFENQLVGETGEFAINQVLGAGRVIGSWSVVLDSGDAVSSAFFDTRPTSQHNAVGTLTAAANGINLVLTGVVAAPSNFTVRRAASSVGLCPANQVPRVTGCQDGVGSQSAFTTATLAQPVDVSAGQTINLTITFTFA